MPRQRLAGLRVDLRRPVGVQDLAVHDALERASAEAVLARPLPGLVEVRADDALGVRARERVARARTSATNSVLPLTRLSPSSLSSQPVSATTATPPRAASVRDPSSTHGAASYLPRGGAACASRAHGRGQVVEPALGRPRSRCARRRPTSSARAPRRRSPRASRARSVGRRLEPRREVRRRAASRRPGRPRRSSHGARPAGDAPRRARGRPRPCRSGRRRPAARRTRRPRRRPCRTPPGTCSASPSRRRRAGRRRARRARAGRPSATRAGMPAAAAR